MRCAVNLDRRIEEHWQDQRALYGMDSLRDALKYRQELDSSEGEGDHDGGVTARAVDD